MQQVSFLTPIVYLGRNASSSVLDDVPSRNITRHIFPWTVRPHLAQTNQSRFFYDSHSQYQNAVPKQPLRVGWILTRAPRPSDIPWQNLVTRRQDRFFGQTRQSLAAASCGCPICFHSQLLWTTIIFVIAVFGMVLIVKHLLWIPHMPTDQRKRYWHPVDVSVKTVLKYLYLCSHVIITWLNHVIVHICLKHIF